MMQPTYHEYRAPSNHNGAAILSLICGALWPLMILIPFAVYLLAMNSPGSRTQPVPDFLWTLYVFAFFALPVTGVIAGGVGLYRAMNLNQPALRRT